jgi:Ca-activated chloride channel family protein
MLEWAAPQWLLLLPFLAWVSWRGMGPRVAVSALGHMRARTTLRRRLAFLPGLAWGIALVLLILAMARPQLVNRERVVESEGLDIMLVLDTSGSMEERDYRLGGTPTSRLDAAKEVMARFVQGRPDDRLGLVVFGEEAFTQIPLTLDQDTLTGFLGVVQIGMAGDQGTALGDALAVAAKRLVQSPSRTPDAHQVMVLLTDGRSNMGQLEPDQAAAVAQSLGIRIHTIGVGTVEGERRGISGFIFGGNELDLDEDTLRAIAATTQGTYHRAADTKALAKVYATIDELEPTTAEITEFVRREERYHPLLAGGLIFLCISLLLGETWLRRLP